MNLNRPSFPIDGVISGRRIPFLLEPIVIDCNELSIVSQQISQAAPEKLRRKASQCVLSTEHGCHDVADGFDSRIQNPLRGQMSIQTSILLKKRETIFMKHCDTQFSEGINILSTSTPFKKARFVASAR